MAMNSTLKKIILSFLLCGLIIPLVIKPQKAHAIFGLGIDAVVEQGFRIALEAAKRQALAHITNNIIDWIENGGSPRFITNWESFFSEITNSITTQFVGELGLGFLCSPFGFNIQISINRAPRFATYAACTLDTVVSNIENFYNDFRNGGWIAFAESWQPQNNYYGSVLLALQERDRRIAQEGLTGAIKSLANQGFLSTESCQIFNGRVNCHITTPGPQVAALLSKAMGTDIDYIVNSQELSVYAAAIADALINRAIRAGAEGILGLKVQRADVVTVLNTDPCSGLSGPSLRDCRKVPPLELQGLSFVQSAYIQEIDATLAPLSEAESALIDSAYSTEEVINDLTNLTACSTRYNFTSKINLMAELISETTKLNNLRAEITSLDGNVRSLLNARGFIGNASPGVGGADAVATNFYNVSGLLDPNRAISLLETKSGQSLSIITENNQKLIKIRSELNACLASRLGQ